MTDGERMVWAAAFAQATLAGADAHRASEMACVCVTRLRELASETQRVHLAMARDVQLGETKVLS